MRTYGRICLVLSSLLMMGYGYEILPNCDVERWTALLLGGSSLAVL